MLPVTASCAICHLDGWMQTPVAPQAKGNAGELILHINMYVIL